MPFLLIIFIFGIFIGSFLNVCIYRIPKGESIAYPPSHCPACSYGIKFYDLIPIFSYLFLRGKCRSCGEKISIRYPLIETLTGIIYVLCYLKFGIGIELLKSVLLSSILIITAFIDLEYNIIPLKLMIFGAISGIILNIIGYEFNGYLLDYLYGFLLGGGVIAAIVILTKGMGGGDIQLMALIGMYLGFRYTVLTLILSFIIGACAGIILIVLKKKSRRDYIPFGPWISTAALLSLLWGEYIIRWYISLL